MKTYTAENSPKTVLLLTSVLVLLTIIPLYFSPLLASLSPWKASPSSRSPSPSHIHPIDTNPVKLNVRPSSPKCDISSGEWVHSPREPIRYTNETCRAIHDHQNCMKYGKPDTGSLKWKWKPNQCELAAFNPAQFLEMVRGKSMAFVGDSVGRNQMQSLMCLLSKVTYTVDASPTTDEKFKRWSYPTHDFILANFWSPYLVTAEEADPLGPVLSGLFNLQLDEPDSNWTTQVRDFDYVIISAGHWFFRPTMYYENNHLIGCFYCSQPNITHLTVDYGYRQAFCTAFRALNTMKGYKGMTILRTFAPAHFENGEWDKGGDCIRTRPFRSNETRLDGINMEMYMTQLEEFRVAAAEGDKRGLRYRLLDTTEAMLMRPDGHPSRYGHPRDAKVALNNDCVHWCLPGPVDTWNDFLLHTLSK